MVQRSMLPGPCKGLIPDLKGKWTCDQIIPPTIDMAAFFQTYSVTAGTYRAGVGCLIFTYPTSLVLLLSSEPYTPKKFQNLTLKLRLPGGCENSWTRWMASHGVSPSTD